MIQRTFLLSAAAALLIGIGNRFLLSYSWVAVINHDPLPHWMHVHGVAAVTIGYVSILTGFLTDVVVSLPAALALLLLRPGRLLAYLALAVVPCFLWVDVAAHVELGLGWDLIYALACARVLLALPVAAWLLSLLRRARLNGEARLVAH